MILSALWIKITGNELVFYHNKIYGFSSILSFNQNQNCFMRRDEMLFVRIHLNLIFKNNYLVNSKKLQWRDRDFERSLNQDTVPPPF